MNRNEQVRVLQGYTDEKNTRLLSALLDMSEEKIRVRLYPMTAELNTEIPERYANKVVELAVILYNRRGIEGEKSHNEIGVNRSFESESELLKSIIPYAEVI